MWFCGGAMTQAETVENSLGAQLQKVFGHVSACPNHAFSIPIPANTQIDSHHERSVKNQSIFRTTSE
jgi:hypothetical protein